MIPRTLTITASALAVLFSSCHPIKETPRNPIPKEKTAEEIAKEKDEEARKKAEEELKKKQEEEEKKLIDPVPDTPDGPTTGSTGGSGTTGSGDYPFANKVPGKDGFVFSPYNNKVVDVRDIPSGTLVADPTYPAAEKKYFRVP